MAVDAAARRRGLEVLLADTFLMYGGFFMLVPLISVHYVEDLGFTAAAVGIVLAARQLTQQGLTIFGGALADRWGPKQLIIWGIAIRTIGFAGLAWAYSFTALLLLCVLAAIGGALFDAPKSAATAALTDPAERNRFFSLQGIVGGLGMTIGPLVGALLLPLDFQLVCFASAACFAVAGVLTAVWLPRMDVPAGQMSMAHGIGLAVRDRTFVVFTLLLAGFWFMWVQISISLPLEAQRWGTSQLATPWGAMAINGVAWIYAINAGLTVVLQYPVLRLADRLLRPMLIIVVGLGLMALGLALVSLAGSLTALLGCVVLFAVGAMLVQPTQQTVTASMADAQALGSYFGFSALALALGGSLGNYLGGRLYDLAGIRDLPALPWLVFGTVGPLVTIGLLMLDRTQSSGAAGATAAQPHRSS